jgi:hypothetical protein
MQASVMWVTIRAAPYVQPVPVLGSVKTRADGL